MNAQELITELSRQGVNIEAVGDELRINAPKGVLTSELRQELVEHKQAILTLFKPPPIAWTEATWDRRMDCKRAKNNVSL